ncbi:MAG: Macrolide export ATP-binding/permease protein MacB, partial [uncultured Solirubrobacteraceae bacterium]
AHTTSDRDSRPDQNIRHRRQPGGGARGGDLHHRHGRVVGHSRPFRQRQEHADEPARPARPAHVGQVYPPWSRCRASARRRAGESAAGADRLRLPEFQPDAPRDGPRERRATDDIRGRPRSGAEAARARRARSGGPGGPRGPQAPRALRRSATAGCHRASDREPSSPPARGRANGQPGQRIRCGDPRPVRGAEPRRGHAHRRDARCGGGGARPPRYRDPRRPQLRGPARRASKQRPPGPDAGATPDRSV